MALLYSPAATVTVAANTDSLTITGMDLSAVLVGMVIHIGARDRVTGDGYIIDGVTPSGTTGGTISTIGPIPSGFTNAAFVIDTRDFNGSAPNYLIAMYTSVLNALLRLTSPLTNLLSGSRTLALDKDTAPAISRLLYAIAGRLWGGLEQRTLSYTPTGGAATPVETLALRAFPDGTTPVDSLIVDLSTGGVDVLAASVSMTAASTTDLGSAPMRKVTIGGSGSINSFGAARHKERLLLFSSAVTLVHNATSLALPTGANIVTAAGDTAVATSDASGNWRVRSYQRASGAALATPGLIVGTDVQAYDPDLAAIAALSTQAFGRSLLTQADGAATRSTIGLSAANVPTFQSLTTNAATYSYQQATSGAVTGQFAANANGSVELRSVSAHPIYFYANNTLYMAIETTGNIRPNIDAGQSLGSPSYRFANIYGSSGIVNTSDAREKTEIAELSASEIAAASDLAREIGTYQFLASINEKGPDEARRHVGMTVQRAISILEAHGLDAYRYGLICWDAWEATEAVEGTPAREAVLDEDGVVVEPARPEVMAIPAKPAGDRFGFRTDQLALFIARGQEARLAAIEARIAP